MNRAACFTLQTRMVYHYLRRHNRLTTYNSYLRGEIDRNTLYASVPNRVHRSVIHAIINEETISSIFERVDRLVGRREVDVIVGGPPCQAYSVVGRARDKNGMRGDERNYLYKYYARFLTKYEPKAFVFENVLGLQTAENGLYLRNMKAYFKRIGYELAPIVLNARDYGVLQNRRRIIIVGWRKELTSFRLPTLRKVKWNYTVADAIQDLLPIQAGEGTLRASGYGGPTTDYLKRTAIRNGRDTVTLHYARPHSTQDLEIYRIAVREWTISGRRLQYLDLPRALRTHSNTTSFHDRFKVVAAEATYSHTIVAHINRDGHHYIHPDIHQNRSLSIREAARIQSFPDDYYFEGITESNPRTAAFKQIGNAVPPLMAHRLAQGLAKMLRNG